ncbi:MAG: hypothetical protein IJY62_01690 [Clostridia bacterium]|nr:hypothetical protein [Clostridia bacterium]
MKKISIIQEVLWGRISDELGKLHLEENGFVIDEKFNRFLENIKKYFPEKIYEEEYNALMDWVIFENDKNFRNGARFGLFLALELTEDWK